MRNLLFSLIVVMFAATQASAALILTNGSFEAPNLSSGGNQQITATATIQNWTAGNNSAFYLEQGLFSVNADDGDQYIQLNTDGTGGRISQLLGTTDAGPASNITLSASFYDRPSNPGGTYSFGLYSDAAGTVALNEVTGGTPGTGTWSADSVTALGVAGETDVYAFFSADTNAVEGTQLFWVDNATLSVTPVPEPSSMVLAGLGGLLCVARRRRRH